MVEDIKYWLTKALIYAVGIAGLCVMYYFTVAARLPITWHVSYVEPEIVHAGGTINVTRKFTQHRAVAVTVMRKIVSGDCSKHCIIYELEPSTRYNAEGDYNRTVAHKIPERVQPGVYRIEFEMHWQNAFGYTYGTDMPSLLIEVR